MEKASKYVRMIAGYPIDVYDVLLACEVTNPAIAHAIKKSLCPGARGAKDEQQDLSEALWSVSRGIELEVNFVPKLNIDEVLTAYNVTDPRVYYALQCLLKAGSSFADYEAAQWALRQSIGDKP